MSDRQTVLVTGGASGIGYATVEAVLAEGSRVVVADIDRRNLDEARERLGGRGEIRFEELDVADEAAVIRAIAAMEAEFGALTGVVNSAAIAQAAPAVETSAELFRKILDVNLVGSFRRGARSREGDASARRRGDRQHRLDLCDPCQ